MLRVVKVDLFWEGHKNVRNLPYGFDIYLVNLKTIRQIVHIFVAFSEKLNFTSHLHLYVSFRRTVVQLFESSIEIPTLCIYFNQSQDSSAL